MFKYATLLILYCLMILLNVYEKPSYLWNQQTLDKINKTVQMKCPDL